MPDLLLNIAGHRRWSAWGTSLAVHFAAISVVILLPTGETQQFPIPDDVVTPLVYWQPRQIIVAPVKATRPNTVVPALVPPPVPRPPAKQFQAVVRQPSMAAVIRAPEVTLPVQAPLAQVRLEQVRLEEVSLPSRAPAPVAVRTGVFGAAGNSPAATQPSPRLEVQTGGFGGVDTARGQPSGASAGKGSGIHTGGFGDSASGAGAGQGSGNGHSSLVADAGFGNASAVAPSSRRAQVAASETPVEVVWKPKPAYTEEARAKKLEGSVTLEVIFRATGEVQVIRVTRGLGSGLDESARAAAAQIRFHPGTKDGVPVDRTGLVQITFEIS